MWKFQIIYTVQKRCKKIHWTKCRILLGGIPQNKEISSPGISRVFKSWDEISSQSFIENLGVYYEISEPYLQGSFWSKTWSFHFLNKYRFRTSDNFWAILVEKLVLWIFYQNSIFGLLCPFCVEKVNFSLFDQKSIWDLYGSNFGRKIEQSIFDLQC